MKRPKTNSKKISWFGIVSVFMLAVTLAVGVPANAQAASGSFDREGYLPDLGSNDYDRAWISVTDSSGNTTTSADTITVTVKNGTNVSSFILLETGGTTTIFTTTGSSQPVIYPVGTTSGYVEDYFSGSHIYPALGTSVVGLNLKELSGNTGGNAQTGSSGEITVVSGNTIELLYGGSTLDTAVVKTNSGAVSFNPSSVTAVTSNSLDNANVILSLTDVDENLNPVMKDVIGFVDGAALFLGSPGTGSTRVQIEAIDQTTGSRLTVGTQEIVARRIMLVETGQNTGVFAASGKVFGSTTVNTNSVTGNITVGSSTTPVYTGSLISLGTIVPGTVQGANAITGSAPGVIFRIIEANSSGTLGLIEVGAGTTGATVSRVTGFGFSAGSLTTTFSAGTASSSVTKALAIGTTTCQFGVSGASGLTTTNNPLIKLTDGNGNYCLVEIVNFGTTAAATGSATGFTNVFANGTISVTIGTFQMAGARSGDTIKVSYLDELTSGGTVGTVTGTAAFGVAGETGTLAVDSTAPDINDLVTITVVDGNLNTSSSGKETVNAGSSLWSGTTTNRRGDHLRVTKFSGNWIDVTSLDGYQVGSTAVRISSTDNTYVWMAPTGAAITHAVYGNPLLNGSSSFNLGTQSVSTIPLVRGASSGATSFLSSASTSSFVATLDGLDNTIEISPDGTRWVSIPIVETGANSSTFVGTIGFDYTAARLTTDTAVSVTAVITDSTGTSTLIFPSSSFYTAANRLDSFIGTGSVVRIFDGTVQEFAEVASPNGTSLTVTKLANSTAFDPDKTWIQVVGNDLMTQRVDTTSVSGTSVFRIGGYFGATYRIRYNDAVNSSGSYIGGDTLAITTSNMGFTTYTGSLATDVTGTSGPDTFVVVTLVDQDLNTVTGSKQSTFEQDASTSGTSDIIHFNENGLGLPSGSSTANVSTKSSRGFMNGGTAKILYASTLSNILSSSVDQASGGNAIDFTLVETDNNTGTFKGSFQLASGTSTNASGSAFDVLKVTNGDKVYVFYNDSPGASAADNSSSYTTTSPITIVTSLGTLSLSKDTAYITNDTGGGDAVVATVVDVDRNQNLTSTDVLNTALKVTGANYPVGTDLVLDLTENGVNTGTFLATIRTGTGTTGSTAATAGTDDNDGTVKAVQDGIANVIYTDTSPSAQSATKTLSFTAFNATVVFDADSYSLGSYALVTLADAEQNTSNTAAQNLLSSVFIQTSSANSTKVRMVESGADTGTFLGSIQVASSGDTTEFTKIKAAEGDTLKLTYIDATNTTGSSRTVTDTATVAAAAATPTPTPTATATPGPTGTATPTPTGTATPTPVSTPTTGAIQVTVISSTLGQPIAGATVSVDDAPAGTTGADGTLVIPDVTAGDHTVTASAPGFESSSQTVTVAAGGLATVTFDLVSSGVVTPTPTPTVTVTPTPTEVCEPEAISVSPTSLKLKRTKSGKVTVTVTGDEGCLVDGEKVTATINAAGKKRISITPSATTNASGQATFTITAKKKTGSARVTFKAGSAKRSMTVKVRK